MKQLSMESVEVLIKANDGICSNCHQTIAIDRYNVNQQMGLVLATMADRVRLTSSNAVNFDDIDLPYKLASQRSKMRLHGLIAKVKRADGTHVKNTWLITRKGWNWLGGAPIDKTVVAYNNQVLGHEGALVTLKQVTGDVTLERQPIEESEAAVLQDVRTESRSQTMQAQFRGFPAGYGNRVQSGATYDIEIDHMVVGKPIKMIKPVQHDYRDIAAFLRDWRIVEAKS